MAHPFLARVARGPVLADGAMGTMLYARGVAYERCFDEVPGMVVPADVRERMRAAGERGREVGLELAAEFVARARPHVQGIYVITSYGRYDAALELVRTLKAGAAV